MADYSDIQPELNAFKSAVYGEEVRDSMIAVTKKIHDIAKKASVEIVGENDGVSLAYGSTDEDEPGEDIYEQLHGEIADALTEAKEYTNGVYPVLREEISEAVETAKSYSDEAYPVLRQEITTAMNAAKDYAETINRGRTSYASHSIIYVDNSVSTTGDGSQSSPFKTLDEAFSVADKQGDIRIRIVSSGTYLFTTQLLVNTNVHLRAMVEGVSLQAKINETEPWTCYTGRFKINTESTDPEVVFLPPICNGVESGDVGYKFEAGGAHFWNVTFRRCKVTFAQCWLFANNLTAETMSLSNVSGTINGLTITNTATNRKAIQIGNGSQIRFKGTLSVSDLTGTAGNDSIFMYITDSDIVLSFSFPSLDHPYKYALYLSSTEITMSSSRWASWRDGSTQRKIVIISSCDVSVTSGASPNFSLGSGVTISANDWTNSL